MKKYLTSYLKEYWHDWTPANAIRELSQNSLDSESIFEYDFSGNDLVFTSLKASIPAASILLGYTTKRSDDGSVGGKGEGWKAACVILLREGFEVTILNGDKKWIPSFEVDPTYGKEVFVITEYEGSGEDLTFIVHNVGDELKQEVIHDCLYFQEDLGDYVTAPCGSRIFYDFPHKLYVGGLFVCDTQLQFSYDLHPSKITLNRDRKTIDGWDLQGVTARILNSVTNEPSFLERVVGVARNGGNDTYHMKYYGTPKGSEDIAYSQFKESYGEEAIVATDWSDRENLVKQGYDEEKIVVVSQEAYAKMVRGSSEYQEYLDSVEVTEEETDDRSPVEILETFWEKLYGDVYSRISEEHSDAFDKMIEVFKDRGISWDDSKPHKLDSIPF